jgi:NAD(P)H-dependent flavin oxidoreductase YrpB (nitropropane dioxygenase family)
MTSLRTRLCDLLGIEYPIVQSGMSRVAGPELVAELCRAGGLGILAGLRLAPEERSPGCRCARCAIDSQRSTSPRTRQSCLQCCSRMPLKTSSTPPRRLEIASTSRCLPARAQG